jgi:hypothetical protein
MSNFSARGRWAGVSGRSKVAALMAAAAMGVAAATPWLFDDGTVEQTNISTGRNGGPRAARRNSSAANSGGKVADAGAPPATPPGSPLPVPGMISELFDGGAPKQAEAAPGGGETGPKAPDTVAGLEESDGAQSGGGTGMGGKVGVKPANFGNAKGFVAEIRR